MLIGVIGVGFVGGAMIKSFTEKGFITNETLFMYDKYKNGGIGSLADVVKTDILFLSLPTTFDYGNLMYDKSAIEETLEYLQNIDYKGSVIIKSTLEPTTSDDMSQKYKLNIIHNPEFLTARTAYDDFHNQTHVVLGKTSFCGDLAYSQIVQFYKTYYPLATVSECTSSEAECMKMLTNVFYASKVQIFTEFYLLCQSINTNYDNVKNIMLKNGWINPMHTTIPGPDGQKSYGGLCFPKDTNALAHFMDEKNVPNGVIRAVITERDQMREDHDNTNKHLFIEDSRL